MAWANTVGDAFAAAGGEGPVSTLSNSAIQASLNAHNIPVSRRDLTIDGTAGVRRSPDHRLRRRPGQHGHRELPRGRGRPDVPRRGLDAGAGADVQLLRRARRTPSASGWSSICEAGLTFDEDAGLARFTLPDGRQIHFPRLGEGWDRAVGESLWLAADPEGTADDLLVTGNDGSWWRLSSGGTLRSFGTGPVEARAFVTVARDDSGRLVRLEHARGQWIELDWTDSGDRITTARSADGRTVTYAYDADGHLLSASGPAGTRTYRWGADGGVARVAAVIDADGVVEVDNLYDDRGRVTTQRSPFGRTTRYVYLPGRTTVVSDTDGTRSNTWLHDDKGRLVGVVDADEQRQSTSYDRWGNPVVHTERDGSTTVHEYDARGRRTRSVTPAGADVTYGYDDLDRVTTVVTEQGAVTEYTYDGAFRNPSTILDPEGGLTRLTWTDGLLTEIVDPTDVVVRFSYDEHGDLVGTTNADGHTARLERDDLGRVTAAITPSGHCTTYTYDPASGLLAERVNPDGGTWRYAYTAGGRLAATTDPLGSRTSLEYGPHGEEAATIDPLGRAVTRQLDDLGNLAAVELPDGARWEFAHDALSRLVATTDPTGGVWRQEFDRAGNPVASIDATGVRVGVDLDAARNEVEVRDGDVSTRTGFDPLGRLTSVGQADGSGRRLHLRPLRPARRGPRRRRRPHPHPPRRRRPSGRGRLSPGRDHPLRLRRLRPPRPPSPTPTAPSRPSATTSTAAPSPRPCPPARSPGRPTTSAAASSSTTRPASGPPAGPTTSPVRSSSGATRRAAPAGSATTRPASSSPRSTATAASPPTTTTPTAARRASPTRWAG